MKRILGALVFLAACSADPMPPPDPQDVNLDPPVSGQGFQLKVPTFQVGAGQEIQNCYFFAVPGTPGQDVWVSHYDIAQTVGSHHMNLFRVKTVKNLGGQPGDMVTNGECFISSNWSDWPLVVNSQQSSTTDWKLPDGVGARFQPGELLMLQTHFVNATTQVTPGGAKVFVNLYTLKAAPPNELGTLFATNQNIRVCPGDTNKTFTKGCKFPSTSGLHVVAANGHFHSRGVRFDMSAVDAMGKVGQQFYVSTTWDDPPMLRDFDIPLSAGGGVQWTCDFSVPATTCGDPTDSCCFKFGGKVETQEHCNAFVYYWPKSQDVNCF